MSKLGKPPNSEKVGGFDFRSTDLQMILDSPPKCAKCGDILELKRLQASGFPYIHVDYAMTCPMCEVEYLFGLPSNTFAGLSLQIWDSNKLGILKCATELGTRKCYWEHHGEMLMTKIFGDWVPGRENEFRVQWKCSHCYVTRHEMGERKVPHLIENVEFSQAAQLIIKQRLRMLGYIE